MSVKDTPQEKLIAISVVRDVRDVTIDLIC